MRRGEKLRFRGPSGAPFVVTVSEAWTPETIQARLDSGEWTRLGDNDGGSPPSAQEGGEAPAKSAAKAKWVEYVTGRYDVDQGQAEAMTRADLIELAEQREKDDPPATSTPEDAPDGGQNAGRPPEDAPKSEWIDYVFRRRLASREDAANYTKDDLIEMSK